MEYTQTNIVPQKSRYMKYDCREDVNKYNPNKFNINKFLFKLKKRLYYQHTEPCCTIEKSLYKKS